MSVIDSALLLKIEALLEKRFEQITKQIDYCPTQSLQTTTEQLELASHEFAKMRGSSRGPISIFVGTHAGTIGVTLLRSVLIVSAPSILRIAKIIPDTHKLPREALCILIEHPDAVSKGSIGSPISREIQLAARHFLSDKEISVDSDILPYLNYQLVVPYMKALLP